VHILSEKLTFALGAALAIVIVLVVALGHDGTGPTKHARGLAVALAARAPHRARRGRPRKFGRPSRAVSLTLPEDVIARLEDLHEDLSHAVVQLIDASDPAPPRSPTELAMFGDVALIVVPRSPAIQARTGAELVPLSDGRALLTFDDAVSVPQFELQIRDALADPTLAGSDRAVFEALADILQRTRRERGVRLSQRSIVVLHLSRRAMEKHSRRA
jgi:hypothetical protein